MCAGLRELTQEESGFTRRPDRGVFFVLFSDANFKTAVKVTGTNGPHSMADELIFPDDIPTIAPQVIRTDISRIVLMAAPPEREIPPWNDERFPPRLTDFGQATPSPRKLVFSLVGYSLFLFTSLGGAIYASILFSQTESNADFKKLLVTFYGWVEGIDTLLVLLIVAVTWRPQAIPAAIGPRWAAWLAAGPILALMLAINTGYHSLFRMLLNRKPEIWDYTSDLELSDGWIAILLVCIQPGIVEELLFRFVILGHLRRYLNLHAAIWITAGLFGLAHIGETISMPILVLMGGFLGYARVWSQGMILPILLHFAHNYFVLLFNEWDKASQIAAGF